MAASSEQCAVAVDGSLLDVSAIVFYNDPDDDTPLPSSKSATTSTQVHPFFQGGSAPAAACHSTRVARPSARVTDPNNLEASTSVVTCKRSATTTVSSEAIVCTTRWAKVTDTVSDEDEKSDDADVNLEDEIGLADAMSEEEDPANSSDVQAAEEAYQSTKAMGDADQQVCLNSLVHAHLIYGPLVPWRGSQDSVQCRYPYNLQS